MRQDSGRRRDCLRDEEIPHRLLGYMHAGVHVAEARARYLHAHHTSTIGPYRLPDASDEAFVQASTNREVGQRVGV